MKIKSNLVPGKSVLAAGVLSFLVFSGCEKSLDEFSAIEGESTSLEAAAQGQNHVPNEVLIKFKKGISENARANALARISGKVKEHVRTKTMERFGDEGLYLVHTPMAALDAIANAKGLEVEYAEPNYIYQHQAASTDTYYADGTLWGLYGDGTTPANQYGSQAGEAWAAGKTGSAAVVIGIIDEGIQNTHPDLAGQIWTNPYDPIDGIDNDGNGYVDDIYGWDFDGNNNSIYDGGSRGSLDDHGTHVAGTIGAKNDGKGVVGVNWNIAMISCKFLGRRGGTTANAVKAVDYLTDLKSRHGMNIVASNNSWGGGGYSQALFDAVSRANSGNILFVAAAGNSGTDNDVTASYPSNYNLPNIIAVAAIDKNGALASFSQYGAKTVHIGAPGVAIMSTTAFNTYSSYNGTSMATPHVTGGVALYASAHPSATAATIKAAILNSAVPTPSLAGKTVTGGRLNVSGF